MSFDLGVYVAPESRVFLAKQDADLLQHAGAANWLVLSDQHGDPIYAQLMRDHMPVSAAPLDVSRSVLPHLVALAARGKRICLRTRSDTCPTLAPTTVIGSTLDEPQWQLMRYLSEGLSNKEIARIEGCTESNIKARVRGLLGRLRASNRTQAAVLALA